MADKYGNTEHILYDAASQHGMLAANDKLFGVKAVPSYDFSKANTIVSFGADFLGTWVSPIEHTKQYSKTRKVSSENKNMSRHYQFESNLSLTGSNADYRTPVKASQEGLAVAALYNEVAKMTGNSPVNTNKVEIANISKAAKDLVSNKGKSLVVAGSNDSDIQLLVNGINSMLNNYGTTIDLNQYSNARKGDDAAFAQFVNDAKAGVVKAVIFYNANPVYDSGMGEELKSSFRKSFFNSFYF